MNVSSLRAVFAGKYVRGDFVKDRTGVDVIEIINATFNADEETIFGAVSSEYVERELDWYLGQSLFVKDLKNTPEIWKAIADRDGKINSNYGYLMFSNENGNQFENVVKELMINPESRRAIAIYQRPTMWQDYQRNGMNDFICTTSVQYFIRRGQLISIVTMRSNDAFAGYRNDYAWQQFVFSKVHGKLSEKYLGLSKGAMYWNAGSLHLYQRQFYLLDYFLNTQEVHITKKGYDDWKRRNSKIG